MTLTRRKKIAMLYEQYIYPYSQKGRKPKATQELLLHDPPSSHNLEINVTKNRDYGILNYGLSHPDNITWFSCRSGHDFLSTINHIKFYGCPRCVLGDFYETGTHDFSWNDEFRRFTSRKDYIFASLVTSNENVLWECSHCLEHWNSDVVQNRIPARFLTADGVLEYRATKTYIREIYGLCPNCNSQTLIKGFNDAASVFSNELYGYMDKNICLDFENLIVTKNGGAIDHCEQAVAGRKFQKNERVKRDKFIEDFIAKNGSKYSSDDQRWRMADRSYVEKFGDSWDNWKLNEPHDFWYQCVNGHKFLSNIFTEKWCPVRTCGIPLVKDQSEFYGDLKLVEIFEQLSPTTEWVFNAEYPILNFSNYIANLQKTFVWECKKNVSHRWRATLWKRIKNNSGCPHCDKVGVSKIELDLLDALRKQFPDLTSNLWVSDLYWVKKSKRGNKMISDMVSVKHKFIIEYDGYYYHSGKNAGKPQSAVFLRDSIKTTKFIEAGWQVFRIREEPLAFLPPQKGLYQISHKNSGTRGSPSYNKSIDDTIEKILKIKYPKGNP